MEATEVIQKKVREIIPYLKHIEGGGPDKKDMVVVVENATIDSQQLMAMAELGFIIESINANVPDRLAAIQGYIYLWDHSVNHRGRFNVGFAKSMPKMDDEAKDLLEKCLANESHPFFEILNPRWFLEISAMRLDEWKKVRLESTLLQRSVKVMIKGPFDLRQQHNIWAMARGPEKYRTRCLTTGFGIVFHNTNYLPISGEEAKDEDAIRKHRTVEFIAGERDKPECLDKYQCPRGFDSCSSEDHDQDEERQACKDGEFVCQLVADRHDLFF